MEAKYSDFRQGQAQALYGCEALADIEGLNEVYGIDTNYLHWVSTGAKIAFLKWMFSRFK